MAEIADILQYGVFGRRSPSMGVTGDQLKLHSGGHDSAPDTFPTPAGAPGAPVAARGGGQAGEGANLTAPVSLAWPVPPAWFAVAAGGLALLILATRA